MDIRIQTVKKWNSIVENENENVIYAYKLYILSFTIINF